MTQCDTANTQTVAKASRPFQIINDIEIQSLSLFVLTNRTGDSKSLAYNEFTTLARGFAAKCLSFVL